MLKVLLHKQMTEIFRSYFYDAKKNKARSRAATISYIVLFVLLMAGLLGGIFTYLSLALCRAFASAGMDWLYFALMGLLAVLLGAFGSVFNTYSGLYLAKDNDLLLSLPIPAGTIMVSRLLGVYLMGLMYSGVVILPAVLVYWFTVSASVSAIVCGLLFVLMLSIFVLTLSCALGWVVAKISLKLKNRSFITVVISLVFLGAYYFFYFKAQTLIQTLIANAAVYGAALREKAYFLYIFGRSATGDWVATGIVCGIFAALFAATWRVIERSFLRVAAASGAGERKTYRETTCKRQSVMAALRRRELAHFAASPSYMLNCGLGTLLLPLGGVTLLIKRDMLQTVEQAFSGTAGCVPVLLIGAVCLLASMNDMAAPSVSLEGKSLWLAQSLPVTAWQVLRAKLSLHVLLTGLPALVCLILLVLAYPFSAVQVLLGAILIAGYVLLTALFGLFVGLKLPNLHWTSEITPIKQSGAVLLALFGGMLYAGLIIGGYLLLPGWKLGCTVYLLVCAAVTLALAAVLAVWLRRRGTKIFAAL